jgi:predicted nucleic acid-binding protein
MRKPNDVISNATPIISLSKINCFHLIYELFENVYIPDAVYQEITEGNQQQDYGKLELEQALQKEKVYLYEVKNHTLVDQLYGRLHLGELETVVGAKELSLKNALIDEDDARRLARQFFIRPIGTLGILVLAKRSKKIDAVKPLLDELVDKDFRLSKKLYENVLMDAGES